MIDLVFHNPGDTFATRAGWTATITKLTPLRAEGYIDTDYCRATCAWRLDGTAEEKASDLVENLTRRPRVMTQGIAENSIIGSIPSYRAPNWFDRLFSRS